MIKWQPINDWPDKINYDGILCWVGDATDVNCRKERNECFCLAIIKRKEDGFYVDHQNRKWTVAHPLTPIELHRFLSSLRLIRDRFIYK